jgi:hypothetical protein
VDNDIILNGYLVDWRGNKFWLNDILLTKSNMYIDVLFGTVSYELSCIRYPKYCVISLVHYPDKTGDFNSLSYKEFLPIVKYPVPTKSARTILPQVHQDIV